MRSSGKCVLLLSDRPWWLRAAAICSVVLREGHTGLALVKRLFRAPWIRCSCEGSAKSFALHQYAESFNPAAAYWRLFPTADYTLTIYNVMGQVVNVLGRRRRAALHHLGWLARTAIIASGVYFYSLKAAEFTAMRKMVLMK
jgi:hypothetical protein